MDGVSMGSPFGRVLANIIMTKLEKVTVKDLVETSLITVYMRYVDDTLLFANIKLIHERLNSFSKNIKFAIDNFPDGNAHFLDIHIDKNHTSIYCKPIHIG